MPYFGLGVYDMDNGKETIDAVHWALEAGYRLIDTASMYMNEESVGVAVKTSGLSREEVFITTKVNNHEQGYQETHDAFHRSRDKLQTEYIDLYLIHWPVGRKYVDTWEAMLELYNRKLIRAIGVSNFHIHHLRDLKVVPMVNQFEFNPFLIRQDLIDYCAQNNIQAQAYTPIMRGSVGRLSVISEIARKYGKTAVQITLRWDLQKGVITIPKSSKKERIISNADIFDFALTEEEMNKIDGIEKTRRSYS